MRASLRVWGGSLRRGEGMRGGVMRFAALTLRGEERQGLSFERRFVRPAGTGAFLFMLFGPPPAGADGGLLGAAAPPRPPLHSPRTTPLGLSYLSAPTG